MPSNCFIEYISAVCVTVPSPWRPAMTFALLRRHLLLGSLSLALGSSLFMPVFAADLLDEIKANGTLKVGLEGTYPPFNYQDESGRLTGFEVDFANALAEELGV